MRNLFFITAILLYSTLSLFSQPQVALASDDGNGRILGPHFIFEMLSLKAIGGDDCGSHMQFTGNARLQLTRKSSLTYNFHSPKATNYLHFGNKGELSSKGYAYAQKVDVLVKVYDKESRACVSPKDIVDINSLTSENFLKIRVENNKVWLLNAQNQKNKLLGNVGQVITIRGNRYVNNNANSNRNSPIHSKNKRWWNLPNTMGVPDIEVAEFKFRVKFKTIGNTSNNSPYSQTYLPTDPPRINGRN